MTTNRGQFYSGTSGLVLPVANKQLFPPDFKDKSRLAYYASLFNSLEVNSSFYRIPMANTTKRWAMEVPEGFRFTFKLFREITHDKKLFIDHNLVEKFMHVINQVGNKKGSLLVQFPPGTTFNLPYLDELLGSIKEFSSPNEWQTSVEFRHYSWYRQDTYNLLKTYNAGLVIHDMPASATPETIHWTDFTYLRFHGPEGDYRGSYEDSILHKYAALIKAWLAEGKTVYTYFNNTIDDAIPNLITLNGLLSSYPSSS